MGYRPAQERLTTRTTVVELNIMVRRMQRLSFALEGLLFPGISDKTPQKKHEKKLTFKLVFSCHDFERVLSFMYDNTR